MQFPVLPVKWNWSWGFALLIAVPALLLALLGLRAIRAERIEQEQQLREQQTQIARLADEALTSRLTSLEAASELSLTQNSPNTVELPPGVFYFSIDASGILRFPAERIYFGEQQSPVWSPTVEQLIEHAQAAKTQGHHSVARTEFQLIAQQEPRLRDWSAFNAATTTYEAGDIGALANLLNPGFARSEGVSPTGLPIALLAGGYVGRLSATEQARFSEFIDATLRELLRGRWWLSYEERLFYDQQLRQSVGRGASASTDELRLKLLPLIQQVIHRMAPAPNEGRRSFERSQTLGFLVTWRAKVNSQPRTGLVLSPAALQTVLESILPPLLSRQSFSAEVHDTEGNAVWGMLKSPSATTQRLRGAPGLELAFSGTEARWFNQKQLMWIGFILLLIATMVAGLTMTARTVRREIELGQMQNEFIAAVSHEFKSPIASIRLLMERMTTGKVQDAKTTVGYYAAIDRESERLERLVNRLLDWQQIQAGRKRYSFVSASLAAIASKAVEEMRPQLEAKGIFCEARFDAPPVDALIDEATVTDAIENLIDNAIKYSPAGSTIEVSCTSDGHRACVSVRDHGVGITPDELPHIFDRFYRGRRGDIANVHGTGLGLALVKATVEAHRGETEVISQPGAGSCFRLWLPLMSEPGAVAMGSRESTRIVDPLAIARGTDTGLKT